MTSSTTPETHTAMGRPRDVGTLEDTLVAASPRLLAYFARRVPTREDAEDLLGEVMVVAWRRARHAPADDTALEMWLFGVARNTLGTFYRSQGRRRRPHDRVVESTTLTSASGGAQEARVEELREALLSLTSRDRELVTLIHWDGFAVHEAGTILGISATTARSRYSRLRQRLRVLLASTTTE